MSLSTKVIDRLFERLGATYGASWSKMWADVPLVDVKTAWAHELSGFATHLQDLAWALENLPERPPNIIEFRNLCRKAPRIEPLRIENIAAMPERVNEELNKLRTIIIEKPKKSDPTDWARRHIARYQAGEKVMPLTLRFAREALGIKI
jgi:hypothetical protein